MLALEVLLDVACCACGQRMAVTVRCEGDGLMDETTRSLLHIACTLCNQVNHAIFSPDTGEVIEVMDELRIIRRPEPSLN